MDLLLYILRFVLHLLIVWGIWLLIKPLVERHLRQVGQKVDFRIKHKMSIFGKRVSSVKKRLWLYRHLDNLLYFVHRKYEPGISVMRFMTRTAIVFIAVFLSGLLTLSELPGQLSFNNPFLEGITFNEGRSIQGLGDFHFYGCDFCDDSLFSYEIHLRAEEGAWKL